MSKTASTSYERIVNTATVSQPINTDDYPFISGLRDLGLNAVVRGNNIGLTPPDRVQPYMLEIARDNRDAIIKEIDNLLQHATADAAGDTVGAGLQASRWSDPRHDLDELERVFSNLFFHCARIGVPPDKYWDGEPEPKPERPYCYLRAELVDNKYLYWPMLADEDGQDYVWVDAGESNNAEVKN